jgi:hypothetical protein
MDYLEDKIKTYNGQRFAVKLTDYLDEKIKLSSPKKLEILTKEERSQT